MIRNLLRSRRTTCRHPSVCPTTPGPDSLMCPTHAADEALTPTAGNRLAPWPFDRPARPGNTRQVPGWPTRRTITR